MGMTLLDWHGGGSSSSSKGSALPLMALPVLVELGQLDLRSVPAESAEPSESQPGVSEHGSSGRSGGSLLRPRFDFAVPPRMHWVST
jgi:hypothetical protein